MGEGAPRISDAEWDVMEVVRERGTVTPADVIDQGARARGWGWLAAGLLLALAVTGLTDAALLIPAGGPPAATIAMPGQAEGKPRQAADAAPGQAGTEPGRRPSRSRNRSPTRSPSCGKTQIREPERWGPAIRTLAQIGRLAVPYLIDELDRTTEAAQLRSLAFTLRAIGDPRAVPALIRAIPRTLVDNAGDNGLAVFNPAAARVPATARHGPGGARLGIRVRHALS